MYQRTGNPLRGETMSTDRIRAVVCMAVGIAGGSGPTQAIAQEATVRLEEIIVTAQKRTQALQDVPMSITAFTADDLQRSGAVEFRDYAVRVPNLSFGYTNSLSANARSIAIRGVFGAGTTGVYLDDTPLPESIDPSLADLERVEILRGPQGTLYGARSMGGTLRLITRQPDASQFQAHARAGVSSTESGGTNYLLDGVVNLPLIQDTLGLRVNGFYRDDAGIFDRVASPDAPVPFERNENVDASTHVGGQLSLRWEALEGRLAVTPRVAVEEVTTDGRSYADVEAGNLTHVRLFDQDEDGKSTWNLYTLTAQYDAQVGAFTSATSYSDRDFRDSEDFSELAVLLIAPIPVPAVIRARGTQESFAQEFRFSSGFEGPLQVTGGVFYQDQENTTHFPPTPVVPYFDDIFSQDLSTDVTELAIFAEANYALTDKLTLIAGARWFDNEVDFVGSQDGALVAPDTFSGSQDQSGTNPKFGLEYQATDDAKVYVTAAKGFRIGGVNSFSNLLCEQDLANLGLTAESAQTFESDSLWSYELGAKTTWFNRRATFNAAAFYIDWSDVQQLAALPSCGFFLTVNAGEARSRGLEFELSAAPTDSTSLTLAVGYTDAEIVDGGGLPTLEEGDPIQHVPEWTASVSIDQDFQLASLPMFAHFDFSYVDESYSANNDAVNPRLRPSYEIANLRVGMYLDRWELTLSVDNMFDEAANLSDNPPLAIEYPGRPRIVMNQPRTIGLEALVRF